MQDLNREAVCKTELYTYQNKFKWIPLEFTTIHTSNATQILPWVEM